MSESCLLHSSIYQVLSITTVPEPLSAGLIIYRRLNEDITADIQNRVTFYVNRMYKDKLINDKTKQYLIQTDVKPGRFYILPKIHKPGNPGRPIVSSNSHPTERISHFVDYHLQPLVHKLPSLVKDTNDFLNKLLTISNLPANSLLVTLDVSSLYTNIPHNEGINACDHFLRTSSHNTILRGTLGGTQYRNTVRKKCKYRNTVCKIYKIPIPHFQSATLHPLSAFSYLSHVPMFSY